MPVGQPKTGGSWWRDLTECGPLEKGMANHFNLIHPIKYLPYFYLFHSHHSRELSIISALNSVYSIHSSTSSYLDLCHYSTKTVAFPIIDDIYIVKSNRCFSYLPNLAISDIINHIILLEKLFSLLF